MKVIYKLFGLFLSKAFPLFLASVANIGSFNILYIFMSRTIHDPLVIGAIGMGNMTMNMTLRSYVLGFNGSLITMLSQAYGSRHLERMGSILNKAFVLHTLWMVPLLIILFYTKHILMGLGQSEGLSENVQLYVRIAMFGFVFQLYFDIYRKLLNSMRLFHVHSPVTYVTLVLHGGWCYILISYLNLEIIGAGIASIIQSFTNFIVIFAIVHCFGYGRD